MSKATGKFVKGALILSVAALFAKVLSAFFRIPLGSLIGNVGMGYYGYGYPIYTFLSSIAIVAIPSTISKLVAEKRVLGQYKEAHLIFKHTMRFMIIVGLIMSGFFIIGSPLLIKAFRWEEQTIYSLWGLSLSPIFVCIMGVYRGYFQGMQNMVPTAISQVLENFGRVVVGLGLAYFFMPNVGYAAGGASFGSVVGGVCGALVLALLYLKHKKEIHEEMDSQKQATIATPFKSVVKVVLVLAIPISIGAAVNSVMNFMDSAIVTAVLVKGGMSDLDAANLFGQLTNTSTLVNLPLAFGMALVTSVVPAIAEAVARKDHKEMQDKMELGSRFGLLLSLPAAIGLAVLAVPIMGFLFPESLQGGPILQVAAFSIPFIMLGQAMTGVLQGLGKVWIPVQAIGLAAVVKAVLNIILVGTPLGILGAPLSSIAGYGVFTLYNFIAVKKITGFKLNVTLVIIKPLISALTMGVAAYFTYGLLGKVLDASSTIQNAVMTLGAVAIGGVVYMIMILVTGGISKQDLDELKKKKENK